MSSTSSPMGQKLVLNTLLETDHYEGLIKELTCTKCTKYMKPPIHLCVDGHSICGACFEKSFQCHVCKKEFSLIRPIVLESLANKVLFPCINEGCPKHATLPVLEKHAVHCQFRRINCFMARVYGECKWEGRAGDWMDHCFVEHTTRVTELPFITVKDKWDAKKTEPVLNYFLMKCYEKVFNVYQIYDKRGGRMMWTVLVNDEEAEKFYFEVDIFLPNVPSKRIVYRRPCKCEKDADFLEHTQNVYIPVENVFSMLDESESVNFTVRIDSSCLVPPTSEPSCVAADESKEILQTLPLLTQYNQQSPPSAENNKTSSLSVQNKQKILPSEQSIQEMFSTVKNVPNSPCTEQGSQETTTSMKNRNRWSIIAQNYWKPLSLLKSRQESSTTPPNSYSCSTLQINAQKGQETPQPVKARNRWSLIAERY